MYKLSFYGCVERLSDGAIIPDDMGNNDWVAYQEWLSEGNTPLPQYSEEELTQQQLINDTFVEDTWRIEEVAFIADQLLAIEDDDPIALPGTDRQWRDYRTKVRAWKEGNVNFPDGSKRPVRPS